MRLPCRSEGPGGSPASGTASRSRSAAYAPQWSGLDACRRVPAPVLGGLAEAQPAVALVAEALAVVVLDVAGVLGLLLRVALVGEPARAGQVGAPRRLVEDSAGVEPQLVGAAAVQRRDEHRVEVVAGLREAEAD